MDIPIEEQARLEAGSALFSSILLSAYGCYTIPLLGQSATTMKEECTQFPFFAEQYDLFQRDVQIGELRGVFHVMIASMAILSCLIFLTGALDTSLEIFLVRAFHVGCIFLQTLMFSHFCVRHNYALRIILFDAETMANCLPESAGRDFLRLVKIVDIVISVYGAQWFIMDRLLDLVPDPDREAERIEIMMELMDIMNEIEGEPDDDVIVE
uniref:7TM_GPCR_Srx domain-containing protein n=1 Tax=Caenorhabditis tropicalis TaxID=1561998 RepID=A0A1I7TWH2_9PELO